MEIKKILEESGHYVMNTYNRFPLVLRKGRGMHVWSSDGKEYLDFVGGIAVNILGHCHPKVVVALQKQAQRLLHVSNLYHNEPQIKLARLLVEHSFADKVFFCNSGAEANEAAIKLARKYAKENMPGNRFEIITALNSFHGRTLATLTATGQKKFQKGFEPLVPGFRHVEFNDIDALRKAITEETCAVMLEPIQGEGGIKLPSPFYLEQAREVCAEHGMLLILDEVQTGMGRTGKLFAYENFGIEPDIMTLAKGLGGGFPIGAMLATNRVTTAFQPGDHASTFGGNPIVSAAAIANIETIIGKDLLVLATKNGATLKQKLQAVQKDFPQLFTEVRGIGLVLGMEMSRKATSMVTQCVKQGLLIGSAHENVLRFTPPLIITEADIDQAIEKLRKAVAEELKTA